VEAFFISGTTQTGPGALKRVIDECRALVAESDRYSAEAGLQARPPSEVVAELKVLSQARCRELRATLGKMEAVARRKGKDW